jgi:hypothetical protein
VAVGMLANDPDPRVRMLADLVHERVRAHVLQSGPHA